METILYILFFLSVVPIFLTALRYEKPMLSVVGLVILVIGTQLTTIPSKDYRPVCETFEVEAQSYYDIDLVLKESNCDLVISNRYVLEDVGKQLSENPLLFTVENNYEGSSETVKRGR